MVIDMNEAQVCTVEQVRQVLEGTQALQFSAAQDDPGRYRWIDAVLRRLGYRQLGRSGRGAVLAYLQRLRCGQADICLWDGGEPSGPGGTGHLVDLVRQHMGHVSWIDICRL
jgi:hypothetical protein